MSLARRLWVYQAERFPLFAHGVLVAALVVGSAGFATAGLSWPSSSVLLVAFVVTLGIFLQLRILDEFKDAADDTRYRPYRPVPRGLVSLRELSMVGIVVALLQLGLTAWIDARALFYLAVVWGAMGLLGREFFAGHWLRTHPTIYLLSHMIIMPLILLFVVAIASDPSVISGLGWFLAAGYANGVVFEIGRKVRAPVDEETGVETYSALWGIGRASAAWWGAVATAGLCALLAGASIGRPGWLLVTATLGLVGCGWVAWRMHTTRASQDAKWIERASAAWVLALYAVFAVAGHWRV